MFQTISGPKTIVQLLSDNSDKGKRIISDPINRGYISRDDRDEYGRTLVHQAIINNCHNLIPKLTNKSSIINRDENGNTPLMSAILNVTINVLM